MAILEIIHKSHVCAKEFGRKARREFVYQVEGLAVAREAYHVGGDLELRLDAHHLRDVADGAVDAQREEEAAVAHSAVDGDREFGVREIHLLRLRRVRHVRVRGPRVRVPRVRGREVDRRS